MAEPRTVISWDLGTGDEHAAVVVARVTGDGSIWIDHVDTFKRDDPRVELVAALGLTRATITLPDDEIAPLFDHRCPECWRTWTRPTRCGDCDRNTEQVPHARR